MTIANIRARIRENLNSQGIYCTSDNKAIADSSMSESLNYVAEFVTTLSQELVASGLHSEAMVSGLIHQKVCSLRDEI